MCTYNGASYVAEQLESLARQTRLPDELVICDDNSSDETLKIVEDFAHRAAFPIRIYRNPQNLRVIKNFEQAITLCQGDIIALCDQDDVWLPEKLARFEQEFEASPEIGLVFCDLDAVDEDLRPLGFRAWQSGWVEFEENEQRLFDKGKALNVLLTRNVITGAAMAFRANLRPLLLPLPNIGNEVLHDYWIGLMVATVARIKPINDTLVKYRIHTSQQASLLLPNEYRSSRYARANKRRRYRPLAWCLKLVAERLSQHAHDTDNYRQAWERLQESLRHTEVRSQMREYRFAVRLSKALRELFARRYHELVRPNASAWFDFIEDIVPYKIILQQQARLEKSYEDLSPMASSQLQTRNHSSDSNIH